MTVVLTACLREQHNIDINKFELYLCMIPISKCYVNGSQMLAEGHLVGTYFPGP
jgi:hypothetical protein